MAGKKTMDTGAARRAVTDGTGETRDSRNGEGAVFGQRPDRVVQDWYRPMFSLKRRPDAVTEDRMAARLRALSMALQPVVNPRGGRAIGYEALMRVSEDGAPLAPALMLEDAASLGPDTLGALERRAWSHALELFAALPNAHDTRLFLNMDGRLLAHWSDMGAHLSAEVARLGLNRSQLCLEISERLSSVPLEGEEETDSVDDHLDRVARAVASLRRSVGKIALDDFGGGTASLPLVHVLKPDYVKLDRYFSFGVAGDKTRTLFLGTLVNTCHLLGIQTVAKGVENALDYHVCREMGVDLIQGCLIAAPETEPDRLRADYAEVKSLNARDQRAGQGDQHLVAARTMEIDPIPWSASMTDVFDRFRRHKDHTFFPVVDEGNEPLGIVRELDLKDYTYSPFGKDLINNKGLGRTLEAFIARCPTVDIATRAEKILEIFSNNAQSDGLIITEGGQYRGFLTAASLLKVINEKNLAAARDQNPLTKLPGNSVINEYLAEVLNNPTDWLALAYIDFDFFKPFNDKYGFRQGDRAILLFAELMRAHLAGDGHFIGHIGGDDFFAGLRGLTPDRARVKVHALVRRFEQDVASFYDGETRQRGYIVAKDREGVERRMPLLSASSAIVLVPPGHPGLDVDTISHLIAHLKKEAKQSETKIAWATVPDSMAPPGADGASE
jgi:diguanylate cyclase (GGDEF)-like protein